MSVLEDVRGILERNRGVFLSGQAIADTLHVSRAAVWKAVRGLSEDGYGIEGVSGLGYRLRQETDVLSETGVRKYLLPETNCPSLQVYASVTSTNSLLKEAAIGGAPEGTALIAARQTAGRGRRGRSFFSPDGTGLYISLLLRPKMSAEESTMLTTLAAVAMCEAIGELSAKSPGIKWVNDIFLSGRKVCGILTEASMDMESGGLEYAILGLGVNVYAPEGGFPAEIRDVAGCVLDAPLPDARNRLAGTFLNAFWRRYLSGDRTGYIDAYRRLSLALGKRVTVLLPEGGKPALVTGIDERCRLLIRYDDGTEGMLSSGEISIRL